MKKPADLPKEQFAWRWQYVTSGDWENPTEQDTYLHRVAEPFKVGKKEAWKGHKITAVCGLTAVMCMPGVFSRIGAPRCPKCCKALGIPEGHGNPYNHGLDV